MPEKRPARRRLRRLQSLDRTTRLLLLGGLGAGVMAWLVTGWVLAVVAVPVAVVGLPILLSSGSAASRIQRLEAMEEWTRSLSGVLTVGVGLEQALVATLRSTPAPIAPEVTRLVARLRARWVTEDALRAFADELDDSTGDLIAANLILGARRRGAGLSSVLEGSGRVGRGRRTRSASGRGRPRQAPCDRPLGDAHQRRRARDPGGLGDLRRAVQEPARPGHPRRPAVGVRRHTGLDEAHGAWAGNLPRFLRRPEAARHDHRTPTRPRRQARSSRLGVVLLVMRLMPAEPDLAEALSRLTPARGRANTLGPVVDSDRQGADRRVGDEGATARRVGADPDPRAGAAAHPAGPVLRRQDRPSRSSAWSSRHCWRGSSSLIGLGFPVAIPALASLGLAVVMFFLPNYNAVDDARKARLEFARALGAYIDLVALERNNGSGVRQAMESAAEVGDSWVFTRLSEELTRSRWSGLPPWDALHALADELGLPELDDFADIMRLSGEEGASVYTTLRARSAAMRTAMLNDEIAEANAVGERMTIPGSLLGVIFMALLVAPSLLRMFSNT